MIERTFAMLKPGMMQRRLAGEILSRIEKKGLKLVALKLRMIPRVLAETHYAEHQGKGFYAGLIDYITSGPVLAMAIEGEGAVARVRALCGATKVEEALPGTIRGDYALSTGSNVIHASDSTASAGRELGLFF
ncbi:MAG TPA: nucleoside-diphosphate kinase, partial [Spirochaetales bacterium]|nr:nucleoside-diphosphate kinase [Spirochaetales bacterium]